MERRIGLGFGGFGGVWEREGRGNGERILLFLRTGTGRGWKREEKVP